MIHTLYIYYTYIIHILYIHYTYMIQILYTSYTHIIHSLCICIYYTAHCERRISIMKSDMTTAATLSHTATVPRMVRIVPVVLLCMVMYLVTATNAMQRSEEVHLQVDRLSSQEMKCTASWTNEYERAPTKDSFLENAPGKGSDLKRVKAPPTSVQGFTMNLLHSFLPGVFVEVSPCPSVSSQGNDTTEGSVNEPLILPESSEPSDTLRRSAAVAMKYLACQCIDEDEVDEVPQGDRCSAVSKQSLRRTRWQHRMGNSNDHSLFKSGECPTCKGVKECDEYAEIAYGNIVALNNILETKLDNQGAHSTTDGLDQESLKQDAAAVLPDQETGVSMLPDLTGLESAAGDLDKDSTDRTFIPLPVDKQGAHSTTGVFDQEFLNSSDNGSDNSGSSEDSEENHVTKLTRLTDKVGDVIKETNAQRMKTEEAVDACQQSALKLHDTVEEQIAYVEGHMAEVLGEVTVAVDELTINPKLSSALMYAKNICLVVIFGVLGIIFGKHYGELVMGDFCPPPDTPP
eukprot:GHVQ01026457.1.p1 GENE.GHVQ01026457.1~~GHVQ01026457.1.p1  ORF type:complete len:539 (+),score=36.64 GHVQ01026457.1:72-1619(+)